MSVDIKDVKALAKKFRDENAKLEAVRRAAWDAIERGKGAEIAKVMADWRDEANIAQYVSSRLLELMGAENHHIGSYSITPISWPRGPGVAKLLKQCAANPQECAEAADILTGRIAELKQAQDECKNLLEKNYAWSCWSCLAPISAWILRTPKWKRSALEVFVMKCWPHAYNGDAP